MEKLNLDIAFDLRHQALKLLGIRSKAHDFIIYELIEKGFTIKHCNRVRKTLKLTPTEMASILGISVRALQNKPTDYHFPNPYLIVFLNLLN